MVYVRTEGGLKPAKAFGWKIDVKGAQRHQDMEEVEAKRMQRKVHRSSGQRASEGLGISSVLRVIKRGKG